VYPRPSGRVVKGEGDDSPALRTAKDDVSKVHRDGVAAYREAASQPKSTPGSPLVGPIEDYFVPEFARELRERIRRRNEDHLAVRRGSFIGNDVFEVHRELPSWDASGATLTTCEFDDNVLYNFRINVDTDDYATTSSFEAKMTRSADGKWLIESRRLIKQWDGMALGQCIAES